MDKETPPKTLFARIRNTMFRMVGLTTEPLVVAVPKNVAQRELNERASALILELSHQLFDLVPGAEPDWSEAFYRFRCQESGSSSAACCTCASGTKRIDTATGPEAFVAMDEKAESLIKLFGKSHGVLLLRVAADARYKVEFDWEDFDRWPITVDGAISGVPAAF